MIPTFAISTIGCKVNQYESQVLREKLEQSGYQEDSHNPGLVIINTCAVTARAEAKGRKLIRHWLRSVPAAKIFLTGCGLIYSEMQNRSIRGIVPPSCRGQLPWDGNKAGDWGITFLADHSRAFIKVQDGCDSFCSYCVIPLLRGSPRSRPPQKIREEVTTLLGNGYKEVVLTGIHLGKYGLDLPKPSNLDNLIELLLGVEGKFRIRLSSLEPKEVTSRLIRLIADEEKLCPHLHIPFQSGSDVILKRMNRNYGYIEYRNLVNAIRDACPEVAITSDVMVGFPGETDEDFLQSCRAVGEIGFSRVHIFPYSRREGTKASRSQALPIETIQKRVRYLRSIAEQAALDYRKNFLGREVEIIVEKKVRKGFFTGLDEHYMRVIFSGDGCLSRSLCRVKITDLYPDGCRGQLVA